MRISKDNNKIVDLSKVQWAELYYVCVSFGRKYKRHTKPKQPTVNGHEFDCDEVRSLNSTETMLQFAKRKDLLDVWYPQLDLQFTVNHYICYTGQKALDLYKAWNARIFSKKKKKK